MSLRDGPFGDLKVPLRWTAAVALIVAVIVAIALFATDRRGEFKAEAYDVTRKTVDTVAAPVSGWQCSAPGYRCLPAQVRRAARPQSISNQTYPIW